MGVDYKFYHAAGYFIPEEHAKEFYNMLLKEEYEEEEYEKFLVDGFNPEKNPIAFLTRIYYEIELMGVKEAKSQLNEEWEWVEPENLPEEITDFLKKNAKYGLIEYHHWY